MNNLSTFNRVTNDVLNQKPIKEHLQQLIQENNLSKEKLVDQVNNSYKQYTKIFIWYLVSISFAILLFISIILLIVFANLNASADLANKLNIAAISLFVFSLFFASIYTVVLTGKFTRLYFDNPIIENACRHTKMRLVRDWNMHMFAILKRLKEYQKEAKSLS